jgi:hypothetical protein
MRSRASKILQRQLISGAIILPVVADLAMPELNWLHGWGVGLVRPVGAADAVVG